MTDPRPGDIVATDAYARDATEARALFDALSTSELLTLQVAFESSLRIVDDPRLVVFAAGRLALIAIVLRARNAATVPPMDLFAWIGEDELGSGVVGIKARLMPTGLTALACIAEHRDRLQDPAVVASLQAQVNRYGKRIRFARFSIVEDLMALERRQQ